MSKSIEQWITYFNILTDIPVNEDDEIEESFYQFPVGTHREDVWHFIDDNCPLGYVGLQNLISSKG